MDIKEDLDLFIVNNIHNLMMYFSWGYFFL